MSSVYKTTEIRIFTTPDELRAAADEMQAIYDSSVPGKDLARTFCMNSELKVVLVAKQEDMKPKENPAS